MKPVKLPHVSQFQADYNKPWLVVGKGPSFDMEKVSQWPHRVCGLNNSLHLPPYPWPDLVVCNDWPMLTSCMLIYWEGATFAAPSALHDGAHDWEKSLDMAVALGNAAQGNHLYTFDLRTNQIRMHPDQPIIEAWVSTAESAFDILGYAGVKEISTIGVDCGNDYHPSFGTRDHSLGDLSPLQGLLEKLCIKHQITWTKL